MHCIDILLHSLGCILYVTVCLAGRECEHTGTRLALVVHQPREVEVYEYKKLSFFADPLFELNSPFKEGMSQANDKARGGVRVGTNYRRQVKGEDGESG